MKAPYIIGIILALFGMFCYFASDVPKGVGAVIIGMGIGCFLIGKFV